MSSRRRINPRQAHHPTATSGRRSPLFVRARPKGTAPPRASVTATDCGTGSAALPVASPCPASALERRASIKSRKPTAGWLGATCLALTTACGAEGGSFDAQPEASTTVQQPLTKRFVPLRFVHVMGCEWGPGCTENATYATIQKSVRRLNDAFASVGVKFWIKSNEMHNVPRLLKSDVPISWAEAKSGLRKLFPSIPANAYYDVDEEADDPEVDEE